MRDFLNSYGEWDIFVGIGLIVRWWRSWQRLTADRSEALDMYLGMLDGFRFLAVS